VPHLSFGQRHPPRHNTLVLGLAQDRLELGVEINGPGDFVDLEPSGPQITTGLLATNGTQQVGDYFQGLENPQPAVWRGSAATFQLLPMGNRTFVGVQGKAQAIDNDGNIAGYIVTDTAYLPVLWVPHRIPGDANFDGKVDFADLVVPARNYGKTNAAWADGDFNYDGSVGFDDLLIVARNYGASAVALQAGADTPSLGRPTSLSQASSDAPASAAYPRHRRQRAIRLGMSV